MLCAHRLAYGVGVRFHQAVPAGLALGVGVGLMGLVFGWAGLVFGALIGLLGWATGVLHERYSGDQRREDRVDG